MRYSFQDRPVSKFGPPIWNCDKSHFSQLPCIRRHNSVISQPSTMKFGTHTGGAAGEVCHLWLPCWSRNTFRYVYGRHKDLVNKFDTYVSHICWRVWSPNVTYDWFPVNCESRIYVKCESRICESWQVPHVGQETLTLSRTPDFTHFGEFMISPIHYICNVQGLRVNIITHNNI